MSNEHEKKLTADELKAWDTYAAAALSALITLDGPADDNSNIEAFNRVNQSANAAKYANHMLDQRRKRQEGK